MKQGLGQCLCTGHEMALRIVNEKLILNVKDRHRDNILFIG